jgi:drug/metabolite transporter (DMT)-like permease
VAAQAALLALLSSLLYGGGDFALALASRSNSVFGTSVTFQLIGLPVSGLALLVTRPAAPSGSALLAGLLGGMCLALGGVLFVAALAKGRMGVIAPLTALGAAGVPAAVGIAQGDRPGVLAVVGMVGAAVGLLLITTDTTQSLSAGGIPEGFGAALGFGGFYVFLSTGSSGGWWTVGLSRLVVVVVTVALALALGKSMAVPRSSLPILVVASTLATAAAAAFLFAQSGGVLSLTAVLASLYPAVTTLLAAVTLGERLTRQQGLGSALAVCAAVCIALP